MLTTLHWFRIPQNPAAHAFDHPKKFNSNILKGSFRFRDNNSGSIFKYKRNFYCQSQGIGVTGMDEDSSVPKRKIVEHVSLWKMKAELDDDAETNMLDNLFTIQYHFRNILCMSLGRLSAVSKGYTHALFTRFPNREALDSFLKLPALFMALEEFVHPFCEEDLSVSFESEVEDDVEALFRRGDIFEEGVERVVLFRVKENTSSSGKEELIGSLMNLPRQIGPGVIQLTAGENFSERSNGYTHGAVVRLSSEEALEDFVNHPAQREVLLDRVIPISEEMLVAEFSVDPIGKSVM